MRQSFCRGREGRAARRPVTLFLSLALLLCLALICCTPAFATPISYFQPQLNQLVGWGVLTGYPDGSMRPDQPITRAEFVVMVNRAYGFTELGNTPFVDVSPAAWYYDDIGIAYRAGYYQGTSATTAGPEEYLTREQAMVLLARNLRLESQPGEITEFSDSRDFSTWARGYVKAAVQRGLINGYPDGSFRPKNLITRGEMAAILTRALGTMVSNSGAVSLGNVYGTVTLSKPNTTLQDTTIAGDLVISGGLGLGGMTLDNVRVLGDIIVAGGGESDTGESVVLRNTRADSLVLNALNGQYLSIRSEGDTVIPETLVRSNAFIMDRSPAGLGLQKITNDGAAILNMAGNLENIQNLTPDANLRVAAGVVQSLNMDEKGTNAKLIVEADGTIRNLDLDTATPVSGKGDVDNININTAGTTVEMLPDTINIRPGIVATVAREQLNSALAAESSTEPKLLAGYPRLSNLAPTAVTATFSTNKAGTIYWGVSGITDGSVSQADLLSPPTYGNRVVKSGSLKAAASNTEYSASVSGLTTGSSYYLSAMLVDARGNRSPVKVISFTTPDSSVPNFSSGTPKITRNDYDLLTNSYVVQAMVIPTKSCTLHWALYTSGASAPTAAEFRTGNLPGALAHNAQEVVRNQETYVRFSNFYTFDPVTKYTAYFWLNDADNGKASAVKKLDFTTVDGTPPVFLYGPTVTSFAATSIRLVANLNEAGTIHWVAVPTGTIYPKPPADGSNLTTEFAQIQIANGTGGERSGSVKAKANTDVTINVTGLKPETSYDIWYLAEDTAGNYSSYSSEKNYITQSTLDSSRPTVTQEFTRFDATDPSKPYADTDIRLVFSENIRHATNRDPDLDSARPLDLYNIVADTTKPNSERLDARIQLAKVLSSMIALHDTTIGTSGSLPARDHDPSTGEPINSGDWSIDFWNAEVDMENGKLVITLPTTLNEDYSALHLRSGNTYFFTLDNITDVSSGLNAMGATTLPNFTTISAQVRLQQINVTTASAPNNAALPIDMAFTLTPLSTNVEDTVDFDLLFWSDSSVEFELYKLTNIGSNVYEGQPVRRSTGTGSTSASAANVSIINDSGRDFIGKSFYRDFEGRTSFPKVLDELKEVSYGIHFTNIDHVAESAGRNKAWDATVNFRVSVVTGSSGALGNLSTNVTPESLKAAQEDEGVSEIQTPNPFNMLKRFANLEAPFFDGDYPKFDAADTSVVMNITLDRPGTLYYVLAPASTATTSGGITSITYNTTVTTFHATEDGAEQLKFVEDANSASGRRLAYSISDVKVPDIGQGLSEQRKNTEFFLDTPSSNMIYSPRFNSNRIITGKATVGTGATEITISNLEPNTLYLVYFVTQGTGQVYSPQPMLYQFWTEEVYRPNLQVTRQETSVVNLMVNNMNAVVDYAVFQLDRISNTVLGDDMKAHVSTDMKDAWDAEVAADTTDTVATMKVYQAFMNTISGNPYTTYFDRYADSDFKRTVADLISSTYTTSARLSGGSKQIAQARTVPVDCVKELGIPEVVEYFFAAAAWYNDPSSRDKTSRNVRTESMAFAGVYPVYQADTTPPKLYSIAGSITVDYSVNSAQPKVEGSINLQFDKTLYYYNSSTDRPMLVQTSKAKLSEGGTPDPDYKSVEDLLVESSDRGMTIVTDDSAEARKRAINGIRVDVNATYGLISIVNTICSENSAPLDSTLTMVVKCPEESGSADVTFIGPDNIWKTTQNINIYVTVIPAPKVTPTGIQLSNSSLNIIKGQTDTVTAILYPQNAGGNVLWTVEAVEGKDIVTFNQTGNPLRLTGLKFGVVKVTATVRDLDGNIVMKDGVAMRSDTCTVSISAQTLRILESPGNAERKQLDIKLSDGDTRFLTTDFTPKGTATENANELIMWDSSDDTVVTVSATGTVTAKKAGSAVITARAGATEAQCYVFVTD